MSSERSVDGVWVVMPAYNEATVIRSVVEGLLAYFSHVVVVDDSSTDDTVARLAGMPIAVCRHLVNLGQGAALQTGIEFALSQHATCIVTFDSDGQHRPQDARMLADTVLKDGFEVALASRFLPGASTPGIESGRHLVLRLAVWYTRIATGLTVTDTHNGLRAFSAEVARSLNLTQPRMAHATQILSRVAAGRRKYCEKPVTVVYTDYTKQKGQSAVNLLNILWEHIMEHIFR